MKIKCIILLFLSFLIPGYCNSQNNYNIRYSEQKLNSPATKADAMRFYNIGYREFEKENYYSAIKYYKKAIQIDSNYTDAMDNCALSFRRLNNLDSTEYYYRLSLRKLPTNEIALNNLGLIYIYKNDFASAKVAFKKIIKINPNNGEGPYSLAEIFLRERNNDSAIIYSLQAYEIWKVSNPPYAGDALYYAGLGYLYKGDTDKAKEYIDRAKSFGKNVSPDIEKEINE